MPKLTKESDRDKLIEPPKRDDKLDKRRTKEELAKQRKLEKEKELEKKQKRKSSKQINNKSGSTGGSSLDSNTMSLPDFVQNESNCIPLFLEKCVEFIQIEGLQSEGIYRVPGNRAHVDLLYQKFEEGNIFILFLIFYFLLSSHIVFFLIIFRIKY